MTARTLSTCGLRKLSAYAVAVGESGDAELRSMLKRRGRANKPGTDSRIFPEIGWRLWNQSAAGQNFAGPPLHPKVLILSGIDGAAGVD